MKAQTMKRLATLGIAATLSCGVFSSLEMISGVKDELAVTAYAAEASGTCGTNLKWSLS